MVFTTFDIKAKLMTHPIFQKIIFNDDGLIPVITQQFDSNEVLMMAWMDREAVEKTLDEQVMYYRSRSRNSLWRKGETSGQTQSLKELRIDCDGDTLLALVDQKGVACHTGTKSCFFTSVEGEKLKRNQEILVSQEDLYGE